MIVGAGTELAVLARENLLLDLNSVEQFDVTQRHWDKNAAEQLAVGDKLYFTNCAMNIHEVAYVVYFNLRMVKDFELTSPYEYMALNEWNLDNWAKLASSSRKSLNNPWYGTTFDTNSARLFFYGAGGRATTNDSLGYPQVTLFETDKASTLYEKCKSVFCSDGGWNIDALKDNEFAGYNDKNAYARKLFCQDMFLFYYGGTDIIDSFAYMESEFGIVPFPKYNRNQEEYHSLYSPDCNLIALPKNVENIDRTAFIIDRLNYYSDIYVKHAWYDVLLSRRYLRDDESEAALDVIMDGRVYDVGLCYDFGGIRSNIMDFDIKNGDISKNYEKMKYSVASDIKDTYKKIGSK
jgi:hypothetical protein